MWCAVGGKLLQKLITWLVVVGREGLGVVEVVVVIIIRPHPAIHGLHYTASNFVGLLCKLSLDRSLDKGKVLFSKKFGTTLVRGNSKT